MEERIISDRYFHIVETTYGVTDANGRVILQFRSERPSGGDTIASIQEGQGFDNSSTHGGVSLAYKLYEVNVSLNGGEIIDGTPATTHIWKDNGDGTWSTTAYESKGDTVDSVVADWSSVIIERNSVQKTSFQPNTGALVHDRASGNFTTTITAYYGDEPTPEPVNPTPEEISVGYSIPQTGDASVPAILVTLIAVSGVFMLARRRYYN